MMQTTDHIHMVAIFLKRHAQGRNAVINGITSYCCLPGCKTYYIVSHIISSYSPSLMRFKEIEIFCHVGQIKCFVN